MTAESDSGSGPLSQGGIAPRPLFAVVAVLLGSFLANFDSRLTTVGLADLRGAFSLGFDEGAWLSTAGIGSQIFIAPAVAWLATVFGLRRVLGIPSLVYALVLASDSVRSRLHDADRAERRAWHAARHLRSRHLDDRLSEPADQMVAAGDLDLCDPGRLRARYQSPRWLASMSIIWGWQWLYWQGVVIAPLMGLMVYLGTPNEPVNRTLLCDADWGGMLLLGTAVSMIYAGLDQGNRLDWLESGTVMALLLGGGVLFIGFLHQRGIGPRALGPRQRAVLAQCRARAGASSCSTR